MPGELTSSVYELGIGSSTSSTAESARDLACHGPLAHVVYGHHSLDDAQIDVVILRRLDESTRVLREARASETRTRVQKFRANAIVEPNAARDLLDIGADFLRQIGDLVDEGDLGGEESIGRIFDQFGGAPRGEHQRRLVQRQRPVDVAEHPSRTLVGGADHDAVGKFEVADRRALAQEFRI